MKFKKDVEMADGMVANFHEIVSMTIFFDIKECVIKVRSYKSKKAKADGKLPTEEKSIVIVDPEFSEMFSPEGLSGSDHAKKAKQHIMQLPEFLGSIEDSEEPELPA